MKKFLHRLFNHRVRALVQKEFRQIRRDRRLAISLILPPTLQLLLFGFALSATVSNIRLGVVDDSGTPESRELVANLTESKSFQFAGSYLSVDKLGAAISRGDLDAGVVIPYDYARDLYRGNPSTVQFLLNAMNANTAAIAQGYAQGVIQSYNQGLAAGGIHASFRQIAAADVSRRGIVSLHPAYLFNPGLVASWFIVTGVFGLLLILNGSIVASAAMVKERERGTIEQLLMSPAGTYEIILAKIAPLFVLLFLMTLFAVVVMETAFHVPIQGNLLLLLAASGLCILCGISIGTVIATFSKSAEQAQLTSFFVNPPLSTLSGAFYPVEGMPHILQSLTAFNPVYHFVVISRASLLKGSGFGVLWPHFAALFAFTAVLVVLSVWRFRKQLS
ncbi:MAG: ABC transporter permease [Acidobacteriia bacterium]|nr:ABC transporter permease [Terriglobia bacterium]